jgi:hypothetical protein
MPILSVTFGRTYNLGNYENMRLEVSAAVVNDDVAAAFDEAIAAVEAQHARMTNGVQPQPVEATPEPATPKQRNYIARLMDDLGWTSEQLAVYADEQQVDLVSMTKNQASTFIDGLKKLVVRDLLF